MKRTLSESSSDEEISNVKKTRKNYDGFIQLPEISNVSYGNVAKNLMTKMGFKEGAGLGKNEQGIQKPIEASSQKGKRGLGLKVPHILKDSNISWDFDKEKPFDCEYIEWYSKNEEQSESFQAEYYCNDEDRDSFNEAKSLNNDGGSELPGIEKLKDWIIVGKKKFTISDEINFCDSEILANILEGKTVFDCMTANELMIARSRSNVFETIKGVFFMNRAAMKMANIDATFNWMFTKPMIDEKMSLVENNELLTFADICAGPGGFSEYVLWRSKGNCKGYGFTLRGQNDFKIHEMKAGPSEMFEPHYGKVIDSENMGDGDIYNPINQDEFEKFIKFRTMGKGVHVVMADGGFSVDGEENLQEICSQRLYLCQFLVAIRILKTGGHFVCKLFDIFTKFSAGLLFLISFCFEKIIIFKPVTSRPANSERYLICQSKKNSHSVDRVIEYFKYINEVIDSLETTSIASSFNRVEKNDNAVLEIVPFPLLRKNELFFNYLVKINNFLGNLQNISLLKIKTFHQNANLIENRQESYRSLCLQNWNILDLKRESLNENHKNNDQRPLNAFQRLTKGLKCEQMQETNVNLLSSLKEKSKYDYIVSVAGNKNRIIIISLGSTVYFKDICESKKWEKIQENVKLELPKDTILDAEIVEEIYGEAKGQRRENVLHVFDGLTLYGKDITNLPYQERMLQLQKFISAVNKTSRNDLTYIRLKQRISLIDLPLIFSSLQLKTLKNSGQQKKLCYPFLGNKIPDKITPFIDSTIKDVTGRDVPGKMFVPCGLYLTKIVQEPWTIAWSRSNNEKYYFNTKKNESNYLCPPGAGSTYAYMVAHLLKWSWLDGQTKLHDEQIIQINSIQMQASDSKKRTNERITHWKDFLALLGF